jgi:hypothetical protein
MICPGANGVSSGECHSTNVLADYGTRRSTSGHLLQACETSKRCTLKEYLKLCYPCIDAIDLATFCMQLYKRWLKFCDNHNVTNIPDPGVVGRGARPVPSLPFALVQQFVRDNIQWAADRINARNQNMAHSFAPDSIPASSVDTWDEDDPEEVIRLTEL